MTKANKFLKETSNFIEASSPSFIDVHSALANGHYAGYVFIVFREGSKDVHLGTGGEYTLNGKGDTWFRKLEDHPAGTKGYGLAITEFKITSRNPEVRGNFNVYKATIKYIPISDENSTDTATIFLWVHKNFELKDVLSYIDQNKHSWRP